MSMVFDEGMDRRVFDRLGGFEVGLAAVKHMDLFTGRTQGHDLIADLHDIGEADFVEALGETQAACIGGHRSSFLTVKIKDGNRQDSRWKHRDGEFPLQRG